MTKAKHMPVAPPLPSGCVDFNKLHDAAMANSDPKKAIAQAVVVPKAEMRTASLGSPNAPKAKPAVTAAKTEEKSNG